MARIGQRTVRGTGMMYVPRSVQMRKDPIEATYERGDRAGIPPDLIRDFVYGVLAEGLVARAEGGSRTAGRSQPQAAGQRIKPGEAAARRRSPLSGGTAGGQDSSSVAARS